MKWKPQFHLSSVLPAFVSSVHPEVAAMSDTPSWRQVGFVLQVPLELRKQRRAASGSGVCRCPRRSVQAVLRRTTYRGPEWNTPFAEDTTPSEKAPSDPDKPSSEKAGEALQSVPDALPQDLVRAVGGKGKEGCEQCAGVGSIACPLCGSKGFISISMMETVSAVQCRLCRGRCAIPCPTCREFIYKSVVWWDQIPSEEDDPDENWRVGPDGNPRVPWSPPPA